jgi:GGDEF domain-containing protein
MREQEILRTSAIDSLTGGMNRSRLVETLDELLARVSRNQASSVSC